jgi:predicted RNA-binding Zn ribbon-like protein
VTMRQAGVSVDERDRAAPGRLELVRQFVNTRDLCKRIDWIDSPERLAAWLVDKGLVAAPPALTPDDVARVQAFREALRAMLLAHAGRPEPPHAAEVFDETASSLPLRARVTAAGVGLFSAAEGLDFALGSVVAAVVEAQLRGTWPRLKACVNDSCHTGMYDRTKNRTRVWCNASTCGAQVRARSYRRRRRERRSPTGDGSEGKKRG